MLIGIYILYFGWTVETKPCPLGKRNLRNLC